MLGRAFGLRKSFSRGVEWQRTDIDVPSWLIGLAMMAMIFSLQRAANSGNLATRNAGRRRTPLRLLMAQVRVADYTSMCIVACDRPQRCHIPGSRTYRQGSGFPVQIGANRSSFGVRRAATVRRSYLQTVGSTPDGKSFSQSREGRNGCTMVPFSRSKREIPVKK
jgi:hypothetical protein